MLFAISLLLQRTGAIMHVRPATASEIPHLAKLWFEAWQETHRPLMPDGLIRLRTLESFTERLAAMTDDIRVIDCDDEPAGFCAIKGDELYQLFLAPAARGTGIAATLIADAEARLAANGVEVAWLACAIGNDRAARFYEKSGWRNAGAFTDHVTTSQGAYPLEVWRFEKSLS